MFLSCGPTSSQVTWSGHKFPRVSSILAFTAFYHRAARQSCFWCAQIWWWYRTLRLLGCHPCNCGVTFLSKQSCLCFWCWQHYSIRIEVEIPRMKSVDLCVGCNQDNRVDG